MAGILFLQGETDSKSKSMASAWAAKFRKMLAGFRVEFGATVPLVIAEIGNLASSSYRYQQDVRQQQEIAAASNPEVAVFSTLDLPLQNGIHFAVDSYKEIGVRFANAWWH